MSIYTCDGQLLQITPSSQPRYSGVERMDIETPNNACFINPDYA